MFNIFTTLSDDEIKEKAKDEYKNIRMNDKLKQKIINKISSEVSVKADDIPKVSIKRRFTVIIAAALSILLITGAGAAVYGGLIFIPKMGFMEKGEMEIYSLPEVIESDGITVETVMKIKDGEKSRLIVLLSAMSPADANKSDVFEQFLTVTTPDGQTVTLDNGGGYSTATNEKGTFHYSQYETEEMTDNNEFTISEGGMSAEITLVEYVGEENRIYTADKNGLSMKLQFYTKKSRFFAMEFMNTNTPQLYAQRDRLIGDQNYSDYFYLLKERVANADPTIQINAYIPEYFFPYEIKFNDINGKKYENVELFSINTITTNEKSIHSYISSVRPEEQIESVEIGSISYSIDFSEYNFNAGIGALPNLAEGETYDFEKPLRIFDYDGLVIDANKVRCERDMDGSLNYYLDYDTNFYAGEYTANLNVDFSFFDGKHFTGLSSMELKVLNPPLDAATGEPVYDAELYTPETKLKISKSIYRYGGKENFADYNIRGVRYELYGNWELK